MASFEEKLTALEQVVERLERGELTLDESVRLFEDGVGLSNACRGELESAEGRIQVLVEPEGAEVRIAELVVNEEEDEEDDPDKEELVDERLAEE